MARVKRGVTARRRRKKVLKRAEGYYGMASRCYIQARQKNDRGMVFAYRDRKVKKRVFRLLWIQRINAAARLNGTTYSVLINALGKSGIEIDRKVLSELAVNNADGFSTLVRQALSA